MGFAEKRNPPQTAELGGTGICEGSEYGTFASRVERYGSARARARQMVSHLSQVPHVPQVQHLGAERIEKAHARLKDCGEYLAFHHYYTVDKVRLTKASFCKQHLLCPLCAIRRGAKSLKAYLDRFEVIRAENPSLRPFLVTFTVKNGPDLAERFQHLQDSTKRLHKHRRDYLSKGRGWTEAAKAAGAVWSYEVTNIGNGWHPHAHAIWLCEDEPDQQRLRDEWEAITGDSFMVDVRPIGQEDPAEGFSEVFKYAVKFAGLDLEHNVEAWAVLSGRRLLGSFGAFRGVEVPPELTDEPLDGLPYVELFYRYVQGKGYELRWTEYHDHGGAGRERDPERAQAEPTPSGLEGLERPVDAPERFGELPGTSPHSQPAERSLGRDLAASEPLCTHGAGIQGQAPSDGCERGGRLGVQRVSWPLGDPPK